jgi:glycosyltransferase involved in cell wall biosynthesis
VASISAYIIARNHEWSIRRAIRSVLGVAKEVVVLDYESQDNTLILAENLGARVIFAEYLSIFEQKKIGEEACTSDWLLFLHGNEELTPELQSEIGYIFEGDIQDLYRAYSFNVVTMGRSDFHKRRFAYSKRSIRLYNKIFSDNVYLQQGCDFEDLTLCHSYSEHDVYPLDHDLLYRGGISLSYLVDQANFISSVGAYSIASKGQYPSVVKVIFEFFCTWFKVFFIKRYFIFGFTGFVDSCIIGLSNFLKLVKIRENFSKRGRR